MKAPSCLLLLALVARDRDRVWENGGRVEKEVDTLRINKVACELTFTG